TGIRSPRRSMVRSTSKPSIPGISRSRMTQSTASRSSRSSAARPESATSTSRSEEHTSELQSLAYLVCRLLLEKKKHLKLARVPELPYLLDQVDFIYVILRYPLLSLASCLLV